VYWTSMSDAHSSTRNGRTRAAARLRKAPLGVATALVAALSMGGVDPPAPVGSVPVTVSIDARDPGRPVPRRFLGLSFELSSLPQIAHSAPRGDFVPMLRSLGPGVLRFGGVSADTRVAWTDAATPRPAWASAVLSPADLRELRTLAARSG